jgi:hypothetical protein
MQRAGSVPLLLAIGGNLYGYKKHDARQKERPSAASPIGYDSEANRDQESKLRTIYRTLSTLRQDY